MIARVVRYGIRLIGGQDIGSSVRLFRVFPSYVLCNGGVRAVPLAVWPLPKGSQVPENATPGDCLVLMGGVLYAAIRLIAAGRAM